MEKTKLIKNCFISPVLDPVVKDLSDDVVHVFELHDFVEKGPSGEAEDFSIEKKPVEVDCYHLNKVIEERARGCDLKSIIARIKQTGDTALLEQREVVYGDYTQQPSNLSDALEEGRKTSAYLDSLTDERKQELIKLSKMSDEEFSAYIAEAAKVRSQSLEPNKVKEGENNG